MDVGFIGLGAMGRAMAANLASPSSRRPGVPMACSPAPPSSRRRRAAARSRWPCASSATRRRSRPPWPATPKVMADVPRFTDAKPQQRRATAL